MADQPQQPNAAIDYLCNQGCTPAHAKSLYDTHFSSAGFPEQQAAEIISAMHKEFKAGYWYAKDGSQIKSFSDFMKAACTGLVKHVDSLQAAQLTRYAGVSSVDQLASHAMPKETAYDAGLAAALR